MITLDICHDNTKLWNANGRPHRLDGPASIYADGTVEYWIKGKKVSEYEIMFMPS